MKKIIKSSVISFIFASIASVVCAFPRDGKGKILMKFAKRIYFHNDVIGDAVIDALPNCTVLDREIIRSFVKKIEAETARCVKCWSAVEAIVDEVFRDFLSKDRELLLLSLIVERFYRGSQRAENEFKGQLIAADIAPALVKISETSARDSQVVLGFKSELDEIASRTISYSYSSQNQASYNCLANCAKKKALSKMILTIDDVFFGMPDREQRSSSMSSELSEDSGIGAVTPPVDGTMLSFEFEAISNVSFPLLSEEQAILRNQQRIEEPREKEDKQFTTILNAFLEEQAFRAKPQGIKKAREDKQFDKILNVFLEEQATLSSQQKTKKNTGDASLNFENLSLK